MAQQQAGAPQGTERPGIAPIHSAQMSASQPKTTRAQAGGAAIVFRDYASI